MGRKKLLKLQRKEEKKQEVFYKKESKKKTIIKIVFLVLLAFGVYQINIAMNNKDMQKGSTALQDNGANEGEVSVNDVVSEDENKNNDSGDDVNNTDAQDDFIEEEELIEPVNDAEDNPEDVQDYGSNKIMIIETNKGNIKLELFTNDAPKTVENFVKLASENFYDEIKFHRVIADFMVQGGDPLGNGTGGPGYSFEDEMNPISLGLDELTIQEYEEAGYQYDYNLNSHKMEVGVLAMANSGPNTNGSQFFIVTESAQPHLDGKHTVFGKVIEGMEVVRSIEQGDVMEKVYVVE